MYINFKKYSLSYDEKKHSFSCFYRADSEVKESTFIKDAYVSIFTPDRIPLRIDQYKKVEIKPLHNLTSNTLTVSYSNGPKLLPGFEIQFLLDSTSLQVNTFARGLIHIEGPLLWGRDPENSTFGARLSTEDHHLRTAHGPAFSIHDNALVDILTDRILELKRPENFSVYYDWNKKNYAFSFENKIDFGRNFSFSIHEDYFKKKFNIPYAPINKRHEFKTPPVGWMTWYSTQFKTDEKVVLENAKLLSKIFGKHSDQLCLWVDWEWNHKAFDGLGEKGVDTFTPRKEIYPRGLAPVAKEIEKLGLIPALWIGATNDGQKNHFLKSNPKWVLGNKPEWCGQWWIDPTHPGVLDKYIPSIFKQILKWGYKAIKWDCLPITLRVCDEFHSKFHDPTIPTDTAVRNLIKVARNTIGDDMYMLSCSGETDRDITFAMDYFNAARIGGDIFGWDHFIVHSIDRVLRFYTWHNVAFYADADNLVLRSEFNNLAQARSRVSFYGLTGLPVTMGDHLAELEPPKIDMLKKIIPVVNTHPMDIQHKVRGDAYVLTNLSVCKKFGKWNVVDLFNTKDTLLTLRLSLESDFHLDTRGGKLHAVYDFWKEKFLGIHGDTLPLEIAPYDSAVLRITPLEKHPQIVSTSRHITQGAYDLESVSWDSKLMVLSGISRLVEGEPYRISVYVPSSYSFKKINVGKGCEYVSSFDEASRLLTVEVTCSSKNRSCDWQFLFKASK